MNFINYIRGVMGKMKPTVLDAAGEKSAVSNTMADALRLWSLLYKNEPPWLDNATKSANLPCAIAGEMARLVTIEIKSVVAGSERAKYLDEQYQRVIANIRNYTEFACAKGGLIFKPYVSGGKIYVDYIQPDCFYPTSFNSSGNIMGAVFTSRIRVGDTFYTRLEQHSMSNNGCIIKNSAFKSSSESQIGKEVPLSDVNEWKNLEKEVLITGIDAPLFSYFKMPFANNIDTSSPLGVSIYSRAIDIIKEADKQYSRVLWEYEGSELAIDADVTLFKKDGNGRFKLPHGRERLFRTMDIDDGSKYNVFSPSIRDESLLRGLDKILRMVEFNCGLAYGTLSDPQSIEKTAEEIRASKQRSYNMVLDIQKSLRYALTDLVRVMNIWATLANLAPEGEYDMSFEFDDSTIADRRAEFEEKNNLVSIGIMAPWEFRMWYFGEDEQAAKRMTGVEVSVDTAPDEEAKIE